VGFIIYEDGTAEADDTVKGVGSGADGLQQIIDHPERYGGKKVRRVQ